MMKLLYWYLCAGCLLLLIVGGGCQPKETTFTVFPKDTVDLGVVRSGTTKMIDLAVSNSTDQPLKVMNVSGDCGCITVNSSPSMLSMNETKNINITYDSKYDIGSPGVIYKSVVLRVDKKPFIQSVKLRILVM